MPQHKMVICFPKPRNELSNAFRLLSDAGHNDILRLSDADLDFINETNCNGSMHEAISVFSYLSGVKLKMTQLDEQMRDGFIIATNYVVRNIFEN